MPLPFSDYDFSWFQGDAYDIGITCNLDRAQWTMDLPTLGVRHALLAISMLSLQIHMQHGGPLTVSSGVAATSLPIHVRHPFEHTSGTSRTVAN